MADLILNEMLVIEDELTAAVFVAGLARALWMDPQLLLLDEPTSALDRDTETFVLSLLRALAKKGVSIVVLTHRLRTARAADEILVLENGRIDIRGRHEDLIEFNNLYSRAYNDLVPEGVSV